MRRRHQLRHWLHKAFLPHTYRADRAGNERLNFPVDPEAESELETVRQRNANLPFVSTEQIKELKALKDKVQKQRELKGSLDLKKACKRLVPLTLHEQVDEAFKRFEVCRQNVDLRGWQDPSTAGLQETLTFAQRYEGAEGVPQRVNEGVEAPAAAAPIAGQRQSESRSPTPPPPASPSESLGDEEDDPPSSPTYSDDSRNSDYGED